MAKDDHGGWTFPTFKVYMDQRFTDEAKAVEVALTAAEKAMDKFSATLEKRLDEGLLTRTEYNIHHHSLEVEIDSLRSRLDVESGGSSTSQRVLGYTIGAVASFAGLGLLIYYLVAHG